MRNVLAVTLFVGLGSGLALGCNGSVEAPSKGPDESGPKVLTQREFDLTVDEDRAHFKAEGLEYKGAIGPYAIYRVTGLNPRLVGPRVKFQRNGYAMVCGGSHYFTDDPTHAKEAKIQLLAGKAGDEPLVDARVRPKAQRSCSQPKDDFGEPVPPTEAPPTENPPSETPPAQPPFMVSNPEDGEQINIGITPAPPVGSTVLVRRVAVTGEREHNQSHVIPDICCDGDTCGLGEVPDGPTGGGTGTPNGTTQPQG
jgi:hypothetical protein